MKLSHQKPKSATIELNLTPLIDVVFQLLLFFLLTLTFAKTERELDPGIKYGDRSTSATDLEPAIVDIVESGGHYIYRVGARDLASADELRDLLAKFPNKEDGAFVKVRDGVPWQMAADGIQACKDANFTVVSYVPVDSPK